MHSYRPSYTEKKAFMPVALMPEADPRLEPLERLAQQVLGREEDDFHHTVTSLARKLWNELRDIWLLTDHEGGEQGFFTSTLYIRRDLRSPLEAAGLIEFRPIPGNRIEHLVRITPAGSDLLGEPHPIIVQEDIMLEVVQITPGCVPGIDYPPVAQEIACEYLHRPSEEECRRSLPEDSYLYRAKQIGQALTDLAHSRQQAAPDEDTQPLDLPPAPPPKFDATRFFRLLDEQLSDAFMTLEQDRHVIMRGHRDAIETIKRYVVMEQEQTGFLHHQIDQLQQLLEKQKDIADWWRAQAERHLTLADRHADTIMKLAGEGAPAPAPAGMWPPVLYPANDEPTTITPLPHLSLVDVELLGDLVKKHTGGTLAELLDALHLPVLEDFQSSYPVLHEARAAIGKRIVDYGYSVMAYHVETFRKRGGGLYLALDFGFGTVNIFDRDIKQHFVKYPGGYDHWLTEGFEQALDPPVQIMMSRDSRSYTRLDDLVVIE